MNTSAETYIQFNDVSKSFKDSQNQEHEVFSKLNLSIKKNSFCSILGPSGCGKSTLIRMLSGLTPCTRGKITIEGRTISGPSKELSFVFQKPALLPWLNAIDNIVFPIKHRHGRANEEHYQKARNLLSLMKLETHAHKQPNQLSGGMQQRIAIARALIQDSNILLMDEPFSALDAINREMLGFELLELLEQQEKTVLFVTHSISEAVLLSDTIIVLDSEPARVIGTFPIEFSSPRSIETLNDPSFSRYCSTLRKLLFESAEST